VRLAVKANSRPPKAMLTSGSVADCPCRRAHGEARVPSISLSTKAMIVEQAKKQGMQVHIPARKNHKNPWEYDKHLHRQRHLVENACAHNEGVSQRATPGGSLPLSPPSISAASSSGLMSFDGRLSMLRWRSYARNNHPQTSL